ncbi:hypothetical protein [Rhodococcus sp. T7]|uniref:hypothetical protein n=1 Tax=Rhodococcus sp. T7 TaxID=627444 RepID=UPI001F2254D4|nr:hypothetical protein [Rhodococcus sp. T7]
MGAAIAVACKDPAAAEGLFTLARNGCRTPAAVLRLRTEFTQHGVILPVTDTTPSQPENTQSPS